MLSEVFITPFIDGHHLFDVILYAWFLERRYGKRLQEEHMESKKSKYRYFNKKSYNHIPNA